MRKRIRVGGTLAEAAKRVAIAWNRASRGERVTTTDTVTFVSWSALASVMTERRYELLRHLHHHPARSIRGLARELGRDYKRVHQDVAALSQIGLVEHDGEALRADYGEIRTVISM